MNNKNIIIATAILDLSAIALFSSSFFVKDIDKAVNRRYISLGCLGASLGVKFMNPTVFKSISVK